MLLWWALLFQILFRLLAWLLSKQQQGRELSKKDRAKVAKFCREAVRIHRLATKHFGIAMDEAEE